MQRFAPLALRLMNQRITLGFVAAMVLIASGFVISLYSYNQYSQDMGRVRHTYETTGTLERILSLAKDVETGSRGYIITQDTTYLEPYNTALNGLPGELGKLRRLTTDNADQIKRRSLLEQLVVRKLTETKAQLGITILDKNSLVVRAEGKRRMDALRQHVALMIDIENNLMTMRNRQAERSFRNTLVVIFAVSLLTFLVLGLSYRLLEQELARRQENLEQLRAFEDQLKGQIRQLETSNQELEQFAFVASHDLQEPLRKIQSFSNLITNRYGNLFDADSLMFMDKISRSAERMSKLIKDLLNFSRISNHQEKFGPVVLQTIIQRILDDQELRIKGMNVQIELGDLPAIEAVSGQVDHLFTNLISNALKFTRPDVRPLLRIVAKPVTGSAYTGLIADRAYAEISVTDNGIGFDEKYLDHIFKVFQRLHGKSAYEGTGIGLAICKRVVMYHHGYITARSQPGVGTTFVVILPESQSQQQYDRPSAAQIHSYPAG